ncbi:transposable element Tcb1 transposase [Trichonephila clavipes]|nr:transposable element Tcb1 transposase [Trichonephila clavipes]
MDRDISRLHKFQEESIESRTLQKLCQLGSIAKIISKFPLIRHYNDYNARPHTARVSQDGVRTVTSLPRPARSPELSPIEHIWDYLGWRVEHPTSLNELEARLLQIWNEMSQDIIQNLDASMPDRIASTFALEGVQRGINPPFLCLFL